MGKAHHILYIEDERPMLELVREAMKLAGHTLDGALSGEQGLARMREHKPDLVLLDLMMPGINGWDVYREMKRDEHLADIPVIVVTAKVPEYGGQIVEGLPPVQDYITKPFDVERLIRSVEKLLQDR
jgi:DNA-binding response OmpR family regulator